jgi:hypothetical protein
VTNLKPLPDIRLSGAVLHALRLLLGWEAVIGGWSVPTWFSWVALALAGYLAYSAFTVKQE